MTSSLPPPPPLPPFLRDARHPLLFRGALNSAKRRLKAAALTTPRLAAAVGRRRFRFRLGRRKRQKGILWEGKCDFVDAKFSSFLKWVAGEEGGGNGNGRSDGPPLAKKRRSCSDQNDDVFQNYDPREWWCYFDYKHLAEMIDDDDDDDDSAASIDSAKEMMESISWSDFGLEDRGARDSTLWVGTAGAFTQCHQDAYGVNLVAQIQGQKRWILFPPSSSFLSPTRIPFEESTIFSSVDLQSTLAGNNHNNSASESPSGSSSHPSGVEVILSAGDVLFVPRRWWHHVTNLQLSVSLNTWIPIEEDAEERCKEAIVKTLVNAFFSADGETDEGLRAIDGEGGIVDRPQAKEESGDKWDVDENDPLDPVPLLNPTETPCGINQNLRFLNFALEDFLSPSSMREDDVGMVGTTESVIPKTKAKPSVSKDLDGAAVDIRVCVCDGFVSRPKDAGRCCDDELLGESLTPGVSGGVEKSSLYRKDVRGRRTGVDKMFDLREFLDAVVDREVVELILKKLINR